ncbi:hypothetical protein MLD38_011726 [Melastoma candidum]|uniref:Uncharacterized protein n=1 Tax=Melastoma candidum TaxID=119954 RepID=A0ACB9R3Y9_9MYRT|nr:hypothetical protein MLD38_011726 [Melastoma candidum]
MGWCSHCMKFVGINCSIGTECTFWSCADCGKILGSVRMDGLGQRRRRLKKGQRKNEESLKRNPGEDD